jgi:hypothetical protein
MSYSDGIELANLRFDAVVQARCDPRKGWRKGPGGKCMRKGQAKRQADQRAEASAGLGKMALKSLIYSL